MKTLDDIEYTIDKELAQAIPATTAEEDAELKALIEREGTFRESVKVWKENGKYVPVDGHRRIAVWNALPDDTKIPPPRVEELFFPDRQAAIRWMLEHQLSRRNLDPHKASLLRGRLYNSIKKEPAETLLKGNESAKKPQKSPGVQIVPPVNAAEVVAAQSHVDPRTVKRDGEYAKAVEVIRDVNGKAAADIESGTLKVSKGDCIAIGKLPSSQVGSALRNVRNGLKWNTGLDVPKPVRADAPLKESYVDDTREEVPEHLFPVWKERDRFMALAEKCKVLAGEIRELKNGPAGREIKGIAQDVDNCGKAIALAMPSVVSGRSWKSVAQTK